MWYFGAGAGLNFNSITNGIPAFLTGNAMGLTEGSAIYCNSAGELLFYTNGHSVWNKNHFAMPNGGDLGITGQILSSMQSALIIPFCSDTNKYYVFSNSGVWSGGGEGLFYSIVNMTLDGGLGDVTPAGAVNLVGSTSECFTAVRHSNGSDHWVVVNLDSSNIYYAYQLTDAEVKPPVISVLGSVSGGTGHLKASPLGNKLAYSTSGVGVGPGITANAGTTLFDFDNSTGILSNPNTINQTSGMAVSFSPDGKLLYLDDGPGIYQFDLSASNISASKAMIGTHSSMGGGGVGDIQIGPDSKLYISVPLVSFLDVVNFPNTLGTGCNLTNQSVLVTGSNSIGLPNNITSFMTPWEHNCIDTSVAPVVSDSIFFPNVFSPNGDGHNELFLIYNKGYKDLSCKIYNRWGTLMYEWVGTTGYWDGTANGMNADDGTYYYVLEANSEAGNTLKKNGFFQLIR